MSSQVVTLYEDKAKTNALYPRTKVSAISDDDGKALSETISELNIKTRINYLRPTLQTETKNGVTCTNNGDGTYTLNGTASGLTSFYALTFRLKVGNYKLIGVPVDTNEDYFVALIETDINGYAIGDLCKYKNGVLISNATERDVILLIRVKNGGVSLNNVVIKPMLTDDLSATYDDFVSGFDCLTPDLKMDLLWTNASPTSEFAPQTISLDLSRYTFVYIAIKSSGGASKNNANLIPAEFGTDASITIWAGTSILARSFTTTKNGVSFKNGVHGTSVTAIVNNNNACIPVRIYGVR